MTNNKTKGFLLGAIAAASYGMNPLFTLPLYSAGMSVDSVLFYRYALAIVVLGIMMKMQKQSFAIKKADVLPLCIMGLLFSFSWEFPCSVKVREDRHSAWSGLLLSFYHPCLMLSI